MPESALLMKADYSAEPFWRRDGANVRMAELPLSVELREHLQDWSNWFENSAYWEHSSADELRYFASDEENEAFEQEGIRLWLAVRAQVGSDYLIGYQSLTRQQRLWDPAQLPAALLPSVAAAALSGPADAPSNEPSVYPSANVGVSPIGVGALTHEQRLAQDSIYAAAYSQRLSELGFAPTAADAAILAAAGLEMEPIVLTPAEAIPLVP